MIRRPLFPLPVEKIDPSWLPVHLPYHQVREVKQGRRFRLTVGLMAAGTYPDTKAFCVPQNVGFKHVSPSAMEASESVQVLGRDLVENEGVLFVVKGGLERVLRR